MALSQLRPMVIEGDRPMPNPRSDFTKLPDGSLILTGQKQAIQKPGMLSGLRALIASKLGPTPPVDRYWIPQEPAPAPVAPVAPAPVAVQPMAPTLPGYNDWKEIEEEVAKEERIKEQLGDVSKRILGNKAIVEGKWFSR